MTTPINKILLNQIQNLSNEELAIVSASLSAILGQGGGGGGEPCASAWRPTVTNEGVLSWTLTTSTTTPTPVNIIGPQGPSGTSGAKGDDATPITATTTTAVGGTQVTISYTSGGDPLAQFTVLSGTSGANGKDGDNGFSPTVSFRDITATEHTNGGTEVTITDANGAHTYSAWNGEDGTGATVTLSGGKGIKIDHTAGSSNYGISVSADYMTTVSADSTLSGDGTSAHPLGIDMSSAYSIDGAHGITAIPNTADNKVIVQMTDDVWAYYQRLAASANVWDSASAIGNKSKTVINNSVNTITTENGGTSATLSAVEYKVNTSFQNAAPKQLFVVYDDNDIYSKLSEVNGKGSLFFVCSAI